MNPPLEIIKALSDLNRLRIVGALHRYDELCVCQITELLQVTGATVSRHLSVLQQAGILKSRKEGRWIYYQLSPPEGSDPLFQWLESTFAETEQLQDDIRTLDRIVEITRENLCRMQRGAACCPE